MDAVIMVEDTEVVAKEGEEEKEVKLLAQVDKGENVRKEGSDVKVGEKVLEKGDVISAVGGELGTLAFIAKRSVSENSSYTRRTFSDVSPR
jgi:gephyrin